MKFPIIAFRETWRLATLHARFSRGAPIIKVIEPVIAVIFHRFNPFNLPPPPATLGENLYKAWSTRRGEGGIGRMMYLYDRNDTCIVGRAATSFAENITRSGDRLTKRCYVTAYRSASRRRACKFIEFKRLASIVVSCIVYARIIIDNRRFPGSEEDRR